MKKHRYNYLAGISLCIVCILSFFSCKNDWEAMIWTYQVDNPDNVSVNLENNQITVTSNMNGGRAEITCENYGKLYKEINGEISDATDFQDYSITINNNKIIIEFPTLLYESEWTPKGVFDLKTRDNEKPFFVLLIERNNNKDNL